MVGVRYRRALFPGFSDTAEFTFRCPGRAETTEQPPTFQRPMAFEAPAEAGTLHISARLLYRKTDQYLLNFMFGEKEGLTAPVTEMARTETTIRIAGKETSQGIRPGDDVMAARAVAGDAGGGGR
jgi:hypothetical protein